MFKLGNKSEGHLVGVHPDLVRVVRRAIQITKYDFAVVDGVRTKEEQQQNYISGASTTLESNHLPKSDGFSHAVDLACFDDKGKPSNNSQWFRQVMQAMFTAAILEGVPIVAGGLWRTFIDGPHFELDRRYWPLVKK